MIQDELKVRAIPSKSDRLVTLLEGTVGHGRYSAGDRFLSTHEIAREYGVSPGTARKALVELVRRGYLHSSRRSGHFLTEQAVPRAMTGHPHPASAETATATALMMIVASVGKWGERLLNQYTAALEQACDRIGWRLVKSDNKAEEIASASEGVKVAGYFGYGIFEPPVPSIDRSSLILWGSSWRDRVCSVLMADGVDASRQAFEHLWDLGHEHTALVRLPPAEGPEYEVEGGILGMRKAYASLGRQWSLNDVFTVGSGELEGLYDKLCDRGITGISCQDWAVTVALYRQAHHRGQKIGDRLSIVASGGNDLAEMVHPRPARVYWRFADYAATVVEAIERLSQGQRLPHQLALPVFLEKGPGARPLI